MCNKRLAATPYTWLPLSVVVAAVTAIHRDFGKNEITASRLLFRWHLCKDALWSKHDASQNEDK